MIPTRILIATDERCGCTEFTKAFAACGLSYIEDPQSVLGTKEHYLHSDLASIATTDDNRRIDIWSPRVFNHYDVTKLCYSSFAIESYKYLIDISTQKHMKIIVVWRNPFKRAISLLTAYSLNNQALALRAQGRVPEELSWVDGYSNKLLEHYDSFSIDPMELETKIAEYTRYSQDICNYLDEIGYDYFFVDIADVFKSPLHAYNDIFKTLGLKVTKPEVLDSIASYKPEPKNNYISNYQQLIELYDKPFHYPALGLAHHLPCLESR